MGSITNYQPSSGASDVKSWSITNYPIRNKRQILTSNDATAVKNLTSQYLSAAANKMDLIVEACTRAKGSCGTDYYSAIDDSGNENNTFQSQIDALSQAASNLATSFRDLKTKIDAKVDTFCSDDQTLYKHWTNSDEYKKQQAALQSNNNAPSSI